VHVDHDHVLDRRETPGNQVLWLTWLIYIGTWGMLPTVAAMVFMYVRNYQKWTTA